ncbi:hypothetical protein [Candidatus Poriferisocius sp.]|uniref:hypothetical protein n=1 Tax=Candidatus Poriferisocius sp. TaxID=3101276 RepID=UPI003B01C380
MSDTEKRAPQKNTTPDAEITDEQAPQKNTTPDAEITDELPSELNVSEYVGPYLFPNNSRRRIPAIIYLSAAVVCTVVWVVASGSPLVNGGMPAAAIALAVFAVYGLACGKELKIDESDALVIAIGAVGFPVGHASAQMGWRGWFSRPTWRILLYSNEPQPDQRGLVFVDGINGEVIDQLVQPNPEDWADPITGRQVQ